MKYSDKFDDVLEIVNSLNNEELNYICNGEFKKTPYVKYRNVLLIEDKPVSFIEVYRLPDEHYNFIVLATKEEYRNKKYSSLLLNKMINEFNNSENYKYMWRVDKNNKISLEFALKNGFIVLNETSNKYELIK